MEPSIPPQFHNDADDRVAGILNPGYETWEQQEALLWSWLQPTNPAPVLTKFIGCKFSYELWEKLHSHYQSQIQAKS